MKRQMKALCLLLGTTITFGCAQHDYRVQPHAQRLQNDPVVDKRIANAPEAAPTKIMPDTHFAAGRLFEGQGAWVAAAQQYRKAIATDERHVNAWHRLGLVFNKLGRHDEAVEAMSRAVQLRPDAAILRNNLGFELMFVGQWDQAEAQLRKAIELNPDLARAHINLGMALSKVERFDEALVSFRRVLPEPDALYNLGLMYRGQRYYDRAAQTFERILSINPNFTAARTQLADLGPYLNGNQAMVQATPTTREPIAVAPPVARIIVPEPVATTVPTEPITRTPASVADQNITRTAPRLEPTPIVAERQPEPPSVVPAPDAAPTQLATTRPLTFPIPDRRIAKTPALDWSDAFGDLAPMLEIIENDMQCLEEEALVAARAEEGWLNASHLDFDPPFSPADPRPVLFSTIIDETDAGDADEADDAGDSGIIIAPERKPQAITPDARSNNAPRRPGASRTFDSAYELSGPPHWPISLRRLHTRLNIVRNEIACLEQEVNPDLPQTSQPDAKHATVIETPQPSAKPATHNQPEKKAVPASARETQPKKPAPLSKIDKASTPRPRVERQPQPGRNVKPARVIEEPVTHRHAPPTNGDSPRRITLQDLDRLTATLADDLRRGTAFRTIADKSSD